MSIFLEEEEFFFRVINEHRRKENVWKKIEEEKTGGIRGIPSQKREGNSEGVSAERTHKVEKRPTQLNLIVYIR